MATWTNFDDEVFHRSALQGFVATLLPLASFSTDFSPEPFPPGNTLLVPLVGALTATTFGGVYATTNGSISGITVTINEHKFIGVGQTDLEAAGSSIAKLEVFGFQQGAALALNVFQEVTSLFTTANFGLATAVSVVDFGVAQIRKGRLLLGQAKVPLTARNMILDVEPFDNLLGISNFLLANYAGGTSARNEARVGRFLGLDTFETNGLAGTGSVMGFIGHASAIAIGMRYLKPQSGNTYDVARAVTDPETGAVFGIRQFYDNNTGTKYNILECNFGYSVGISNGGRLFKRLD